MRFLGYQAGERLGRRPAAEDEQGEIGRHALDCQGEGGEDVGVVNLMEVVQRQAVIIVVVEGAGHGFRKRSNGSTVFPACSARRFNMRLAFWA